MEVTSYQPQLSNGHWHDEEVSEVTQPEGPDFTFSLTTNRYDLSHLTEMEKVQLSRNMKMVLEYAFLCNEDKVHRELTVDFWDESYTYIPGDR